MSNLNKLITELKEKAAKATPNAVDSIYRYDTPAGRSVWAMRGSIGHEQQAKLDVEYYNLLSPDVVIPLCEALEEALEVADSCDKIFSVVERVGRETFCHADFAPEHKKARAFLAKYFPKDA